MSGCPGPGCTALWESWSGCCVAGREKGDEKCWEYGLERIAIINQAVEEGLVEKVMFEQRLKKVIQYNVLNRVWRKFNQKRGMRSAGNVG